MGLAYFAYGSNMSLAQMRERCPNSIRTGIAILPGFELAFTRFSTRRLTGAASVVPAAGRAVWGVLYDLAADDRAFLDQCEGYQPGRPFAANNYNPANITVLRDGDAACPIAAMTYIAVAQDGVFQPSQAYLATIIEGAIENGLPDAYIKGLQALSTGSQTRYL